MTKTLKKITEKILETKKKNKATTIPTKLNPLLT